MEEKMESAGVLSSMLQSRLQDASAADITEVFLWVLLIGFIVAILLTRVAKAPRFVGYAPTLLTSVGILGTFAGIVVGLMDFDPQNIDGSIEGLLNGLETAFITSLAGMGSAILFKVLWTTPLINPPSKQEEVAGAGPEEILSALLEQNRGFDDLKRAVSGNEETSLVGQLKLLRTDQADHHKEGLSAVTDFRAAVSGTEETSLVGQLKLLRSDENDRHREVMRAVGEDRERIDKLAEKLWKELDAFAEMLSKSATEQMMNALKEVIADFNKNLTEQFGENFKALDSSVKRLVDWQENYRQQLEQMSEQYGQGVKAITQTEASVAHISEESQQIPVTMGKLKAVLMVNQHQIKELNNHLDAFRDMRDKAVDAVPQIRQQVEQTVEDVAASVRAANDHYTGLLDRSDTYMKAHDQKTHDLLESFTQSTNEGVERVRTGLESGANEVKTAITAGAEEFGSNVHSLLEKTTNEVSNSVQAANDHYTGLLDRSDTYMKAHDQKTHDLLESFAQSTNEGIERVRTGLESGANEVKTAITAGAEEFGSNVHSLLEKTTNEVSNSVQTASEHHTKLLDLSDAYIEAHDQKTYELLDRFTKSTNEGIELVRDGLEAGATAAKTAIVTGAEEFDNSVQRLQGNLTSTSDQIAAQSDKIREQLEDTLSELNQHVRVMLETLSDESKGLSNTLKTTGEQVQRDTQVTQQQVADSITQMQQRLESALEEVFAAQTRAMNRAVEGVLEEMGKAVSTTGEGVNKQLSAIDDAMQQEINRVMNEMGGALAQISGQFTQDYTKLVSAMGKVVSQIKRLQS